MRVGIDTDWLAGPRRDGLYNHAAGLLAGLREAGLAGAATLYTWNRGPGAVAADGFRARDYRPPARLHRLRKRLEPFSRYGRLDVFQSMTHAGFPPVAGRLNAYLVPDLTTVRVPECHTAKTRADWDAYLDAVRRHADLVVTWSAHTRTDVADTLDIPLDRIAAIPLGCGPDFRPVPPAETAPALAALGVEFGRYLLTVGTVEPRKNHVTLFRAYAALKARGRVAGVPLVVVGAKGHDSDAIVAELDRLGLTCGWPASPVRSPRCTRGRRRWRTRRATKGSACRRWRRWRVAAPSSSRPRRRCPRSSATPVCSPTRTTSTRWPTTSAACWRSRSCG